jgi:MFS family permease
MTFLSKIKALESLRNSNFRMFFMSRLFDSLSMNIRQFSLSLLVYYLTGSAAWLGYLTLARAIPLLFFSPVTGALADRLEKKTLIVWASVADVVIAAIIGISLTTGYLSPANHGSWIFLVIMSFFDGISTIFKGPSTDAMVIEIVGEKLITNAIALNMAGQNTLRLLGPVLAGLAIDQWGYEPSFYVMAVLYALSLLFMLFVPYTGKRNTMIGGNVLGDIRDVFVYIKKEPNILYVLIVVLCMVFFSMPYMALMPVFQDVLHVGATELGVLQFMSGLGSIAGSIFLASMASNRKRGLLLIIGGLILGVSLVGFSFNTVWSIAIGLMVGIGLGQSARMTLPVALLQTYTKPEYRARVMSFYGLNIGLSSFGSFFAAILVAAIGVQWSVGGMALIMVALSVVALLFIPRLRKLN